MVTDEAKREFIKPIENASYPGTLAALSLAVLQVSWEEIGVAIKLVLLVGAMMFLLSAFFIFFSTIYPNRRKLWTSTAITFLLGLGSSILSVVLLFPLTLAS